MTYTVEVSYRLGDSPNVYVLDPALKKRAGSDEPIPHMYSATRLCLYLPRAGEWNKGMYLSQTILPWTSLWLYYYEVWHATGEWLGGGVHLPRNLRKAA